MQNAQPDSTTDFRSVLATKRIENHATGSILQDACRAGSCYKAHRRDEPLRVDLYDPGADLRRVQERHRPPTLKGVHRSTKVDQVRLFFTLVSSWRSIEMPHNQRGLLGGSGVEAAA
jgi:hypothetical protein